MQERIDSAEFSEWQAYNQIEPFGYCRTDINAALISSVLANINSAKGKSYQIDDFMPEFGEKEKRRQTPEEMFAVAKLITLAAKGKIVNGNNSNTTS